MRRNKTRRWIAIPAILATFSLLFSFAAPAQPTSAAGEPPNVNGLFWGDGDYIKYQANGPIATGVSSDSALYAYQANDGRLYVALVVDGNVNDNVFDQGKNSDYILSAGWPAGGNVRPAYHLINSELATFTTTICDVTYEWNQGYARQVDETGAEVSVKDSDNTRAIWYSDNVAGTGMGTVPPGYDSSSSMVWNMNNYASSVLSGAQTFEMNVNCGSGPCTVYDWKSPFNPGLGAGDTVTTTGGWPETITTTTPISYSTLYEWEWAMVYEWSVDLPSECPGSLPLTFSVTSPYSHHSPSKTGISDDPTPVTLIALNTADSTALLPIAGLLVGGLGTVIVAPRRRRRRR